VAYEIIIRLSHPTHREPVLKMISHTVKPGWVGLRLGDHHVLTPPAPSTNKPCLTFAVTLRPQVKTVSPTGSGSLPPDNRLTCRVINALIAA